MTTHTPGPWSVEKDGSAEHRNEANVINGADGTMIVYGQVNDADARLIAAAPELLEALQAFPGFTDDATAGDAWLEKMRAAITKATGEQKCKSPT